MNSSILPASINNLSTTTSETWFIPFDISMIVCLSLAIILGSLFLLIIILDKTCHTVPMMLIGNSCLGLVMFSGDVLIMTVITLKNDFKQIDHQGSSCIVLGYLGYVFCTIMNHSFLLQAIYRYVSVVYPTRLFWQSMKFQVLLVCITWIYSFIYPLVFIFTDAIAYNFDNQLCQIPLRISFALVFMILNIYLIPVSVIQLIYLKLVRYVKIMSQRVTTGNNLSRIQREIKMVRRIVIVVTILVVLCFPYTLFVFMSFFNDIPKYHFRIASAFIDTSLVLVLIALFQFTEPLKLSVLKKLHLRVVTVVPGTIWHR